MANKELPYYKLRLDIPMTSQFPDDSHCILSWSHLHLFPLFSLPAHVLVSLTLPALVLAVQSPPALVLSCCPDPTCACSRCPDPTRTCSHCSPGLIIVGWHVNWTMSLPWIEILTLKSKSIPKPATIPSLLFPFLVLDSNQIVKILIDGQLNLILVMATWLNLTFRFYRASQALCLSYSWGNTSPTHSPLCSVENCHCHMSQWPVSNTSNMWHSQKGPDLALKHGILVHFTPFGLFLALTASSGPKCQWLAGGVGVLRSILQ
jgi:hypothetical protein